MELKPCPFCGSEAVEYGTSVGCKNGCVEGIGVIDWNDRPKNQKLREALEDIADLDYERAATNGCAYEAHKIAQQALGEVDSDE